MFHLEKCGRCLVEEKSNERAVLPALLPSDIKSKVNLVEAAISIMHYRAEQAFNLICKRVEGQSFLYFFLLN